MDKTAFQQLQAQLVKRPPVEPFCAAGCRTLEIYRQVLKGGLCGQRADTTAGHTDGVPLFQIPLLFVGWSADNALALYQVGLSVIVLQMLLDQSEITPEMPNALAYLKSSIAYLLYGWIVEWMKRGMQESGTELAKMFEEPGSINRGIAKPAKNPLPAPE